MSKDQTQIIEGATYNAIAVRRDYSWGHGLDVCLINLDGSQIGNLSFVVHPEFDDYELYQAKSTEQLLAIVEEQLESIVIAHRDSLALLGHIYLPLNSLQKDLIR